MTAVAGIAAFILSLLISYQLFPASDVPGDMGYAMARLLFTVAITVLVSVLVSKLRNRQDGRPQQQENAARANGAGQGAPVRDMAASETNRHVAVQLAAAGGMGGIMARQWLSAFDRDSSVPAFGVRPYWTPTGPGGTPQLLSTVGFQSLDERLRYVREVDAGDPLLRIMIDDPSPSVREAVLTKLGRS